MSDLLNRNVVDVIATTDTADGESVTTRNTVDVVATTATQPGESKLDRNVFDIIASTTLLGGPVGVNSRNIIDVIAEADSRITGLNLPNIFVESQSMVFMCFITENSRLNVTTDQSAEVGVIIEPHEDGGLYFRYSDQITGFTLTSEARDDWHDKKMIFSFRLNAETNTWSLRANGENIGLTPDDGIFPESSTYSNIGVRLPFQYEEIDTHLAEIILFATPINDDNVLILESYLTCKWVDPDGPTPENNYCVPL